MRADCQRLVLIGPADCNHCNCNHELFQTCAKAHWKLPASLNKAWLQYIYIYIYTYIYLFIHIQYTYIYIYIYGFSLLVLSVSVKKNTPPEKKTLGQISLEGVKSGAGEQSLLQSCRAMAHRKGVFFHGHLYEVQNIFMRNLLGWLRLGWLHIP